MSRIFELIDNVDRYVEKALRSGKLSLKLSRNWRLRLFYLKKSDTSLFVIDIAKFVKMSGKEMNRMKIRKVSNTIPIPAMLIKPHFKGKNIQGLKTWVYRKLNELENQNIIFKTSFGWLCIELDKCLDFLTEFQEKVKELKLSKNEARIDTLEVLVNVKDVLNSILQTGE